MLTFLEENHGEVGRTLISLNILKEDQRSRRSLITVRLFGVVTTT